MELSLPLFGLINWKVSDLVVLCEITIVKLHQGNSAGHCEGGHVNNSSHHIFLPLRHSIL